MSSIKEQKLALYKKYMAKQDSIHWIIMFMNDPDSERLIATEQKRMWDAYHSKITEVPKGYTLARLKSLVN